MYGELASVQGVVDLSPEVALNKAKAFLTNQGYEIVSQTDTSLSVHRRFAGTPERPYLKVLIIPESGGGVRVKVIGNDAEGVRAQEADWVRWSASLPKKTEEGE
jgi:hypothetical protein